MNSKILDYYLQFGQFTDPSLFEEILKKDLPDDIREIGLLIRKQLIHRSTLKHGNTGSNKDLRYGDMTKVPWFRQCEDDIFPTVSAMLAELFRRDAGGFAFDRSEENKLILTCRFTAILMAAILKAKGIPARARCGFAPYFEVEGLDKDKSYDHWINQYWNEKESRWITLDPDACLEDYIKFDVFDMPDKSFDFPADAWLKVRRGELEGNHFIDAAGYEGLVTVSWQLFHDFHALMNNEILYQHGPAYLVNRMDKLTEEEFKELDDLAEFLQKPDDNFDKLKEIWETNKTFRILTGGLL